MEEANDENSTLHSELSSEKAKNKDLQHRLDAEMGTRSPLQPLNSVVVHANANRGMNTLIDTRKGRFKN